MDAAAGATPGETPGDRPRGPAGTTVPPYTLPWAVRAVPALTAFAALDLLGDHPPTWFLVLTLVRVTLGVLTLVALKCGAREEWCAGFVALIFLSSLVHPRSSMVLLVFSALALVMTVNDVRRRRTPPQSGVGAGTDPRNQ